ncbi:hypothetical protein I0C86_31635 [Plantactinospora sp. S1510]|uniref:MFS transporter n=1 Tax=Plantactinospora alkalitolerans TaxID=2789879 RepID=A0ABS0H4U4_9ACTN|nr:hypothetical protein [Plantactinospora alkalitolerans]MBF9133477.1 hypothetical protein [Plantactinospora alkalitolerans]
MDDDSRTRNTPPVMLAWLGHPVTVLAIVALVVNDHLLKAAYPGLVTGKLSDVAGLLVAAPLLATVVAGLVPRLPGTPLALASLGVTGLAFTVVKATDGGAAAASALWSGLTGPSVILADRTDLAALPVLGVASWVWVRARRRPATRRAVRRFGVLVLLPCAVLAVAATSAPYYPDAVAVTVWRDQVVVGQANAYHPGDRQPETWWLSERDGRGWRNLDPAEETAFEAERSGLPAGAEQGCVPGEPAHCYRVVPGKLRVEETTDSGTTWRTGWAVSDEARRYLIRSYDDLGDPEVYLSSLALVVQPTRAGHVVVVANGRDGVAVREPDGRWTRVEFNGYGGSARPADASGVDPGALAREIALALLVGLAALGLGGWLAARRGRITVVWFVVPLVLGCAGGLLGVLSMGSDGPLAILGRLLVMLGPLMALTGAVGLLVFAGRVLPVRWLLLIILIGLSSGVGWLAPFVAWANGAIGYRNAALVGATCALAGIAAAGWLGHRFSRPPRP